MGSSQNKLNNINSQSYSCIGRIENYKDLSYEKLEKEIAKSIKSIEKSKKNKNFKYNKNFKKEYDILEKYIDKDKEHFKNLKKGFKELCRYNDIKTYEYNSIEINTENKFINASPINIYSKNNLIATQGPKPNTIEHFWIMVEQYNCNIIIMLCQLKENNKEKCACYWDINNQMKKYEINLLSEEEKQFNNNDKNIIYIRKIKLINKETKNEKVVKHLQYIGWNDNDAPEITDSFEPFQFMIEELDKQKGDRAGIIHCSAGVGRTGTFISIYYLFKEITEQINNKNLNKINFSVFNMVRKLKEMRLYMVQNNLQYKFIYDFIDYLLIKYNI